MPLILFRLTNNTGVFYPGETLKGNVLISMEGDVKMKEIRLLIYGGARVHWRERRQQTKRHVLQGGTHIHHAKTEVYFSNKFILCKEDSDSFVLPMGEYTYPFEFKLPKDIPCSFEGKFGRVRYYLQVVIDRPWHSDDTLTYPFTVLSHLDLNRDNNATVPTHGINMKMLGCLCCKSGPITAKLKLDRTGFVPGEVLAFIAEADNNSRRKMEATRARLVQAVTYSVGRKKRRQVRNLVGLQRPEITPGGSDVWRGVRMLVPPCPPSGLKGCSLIDIEYFLTFSVDPTGIGVDLSVSLPIKIGTIPLISSLPSRPVTALSNGSSLLPPYMAEYPYLPSPTYRIPDLLETMNDHDDDDDGPDDGVKPDADSLLESEDFAPFYPYYDFSIPTETEKPNEFHPF